MNSDFDRSQRALATCSGVPILPRGVSSARAATSSAVRPAFISVSIMPGETKLLGQGLGQGVHRTLGGGIGRLAAGPHLAPHGADVQDAAPLPPQHPGQHRPDRVVDPLHVHGKEAVPLLSGDLADEAHVRDAGVVDQHVHRRQGRHCPLHSRPIRHVAADGQGAGLPRQRRRRSLVFFIQKRDPAAPRRKQPHRRGSDAPAAAGNEYVFHRSVLFTQKRGATHPFE